MLLFRNGLCWSLVVSPSQRNLTLILCLRVIRVARGPWELNQPVPLILRRRAAVGAFVPDKLQSSSSSSIVQVGTLPAFLVQDHHLHLRHHPPLFCNLFWFNIKATCGHHAIFQKGDELLAKDAIEPFSGGAGFLLPPYLFLSIQVAYIPSSSLIDLITMCTYLPIRCQQSDRYSFLFNQAIMLFILISRHAYFHVTIIKHYHHFYGLFGITDLTSGKVCLLGWLQSLGFCYSH